MKRPTVQKNNRSALAWEKEAKGLLSQIGPEDAHWFVNHTPRKTDGTITGAAPPDVTICFQGQCILMDFKEIQGGAIDLGRAVRESQKKHFARCVQAGGKSLLFVRFVLPSGPVRAVVPLSILSGTIQLSELGPELIISETRTLRDILWTV